MVIKVLLIIFSMGVINLMNYYTISYEQMLNIKNNDFPLVKSTEFNNEPISIEKDSEKIITNDKKVIFSMENLQDQLKSPFIIGHSIIFTLEILSTLSFFFSQNRPLVLTLLITNFINLITNDIPVILSDGNGTSDIRVFLSDGSGSIWDYFILSIIFWNIKLLIIFFIIRTKDINKNYMFYIINEILIIIFQFIKIKK